MKGFPDLPPVWWLGSMGITYLGNWLVPTWNITIPGQTGASYAILAVSLVLIGWSALWFFRKKTPIEPHHRPKALIVEGPYTLSRNPIYLALVMITVSSAIGHGSWLALIAAAGLWWVLDRRFARVEEQVLLAEFGEVAQEYLDATRRWF